MCSSPRDELESGRRQSPGDGAVATDRVASARREVTPKSVVAIAMKPAAKTNPDV
ncbi:hypothetical protein OB955_16125 [Halobacteria archaeon AArc-m2/3/4]|uniref:Uncharacterized protein n=1 Tax=Natronoglomus mannanivorans TaxID=2979990 RepID=A0AAP3E3I7_9EURY|nr:hypothetical protein [Halobacteria archaeon AArc-xg1-1]MCU4974254.1 hypothetical protein [Halobacteria archaeon AArc-m2/3/4]